MREPITVDHIDGDVAFLSDGPNGRHARSSRSARAELYGVEIGVGDDE